MHVGSDSVALDDSRRGLAPAHAEAEPDRVLYEGLMLESPLVLIDQALISAYAEMSGDKNPVHLDPQFAQSLGLKTTIAHGALVFSRATGLAYSFGCLSRVGVQFTETDLKFKRPVYAGDYIGLHLKIVEIKGLRRGLVRVLATAKVVNQDGDIVQEYEWHGFYRSSPGLAKVS